MLRLAPIVQSKRHSAARGSAGAPCQSITWFSHLDGVAGLHIQRDGLPRKGFHLDKEKSQEGGGMAGR